METPISCKSEGESCEKPFVFGVNNCNIPGVSKKSLDFALR